MCIDIEQKVFRIVDPCNAAFVFRIVTGRQHDIHLVRHRDVAHAAHGTAGVAVVHVAVRTAFEQVLVVFDIVGIEIGRTREIAHFGTDAVKISVGVLELVEHVAGDHLHRADAFEIVAQPFEDKGGDHFALAYPAVAVDLDYEDAAVVLFDHKQRSVARRATHLFHLFVDDRQARFFYVAEIIGFRLERRDDRLDVACGTFDVEVTDLRD